LGFNKHEVTCRLVIAENKKLCCLMSIMSWC